MNPDAQVTEWLTALGSLEVALWLNLLLLRYAMHVHFKTHNKGDDDDQP